MAEPPLASYGSATIYTQQYPGNTGAACAPNHWTPNTGTSPFSPNYAQYLGMDAASKQAAAVHDLAAAIRELADVLYHISTDD